MNLRSPLRYPGGKSRALRRIFEKFPPQIEEFREPFVGGGSVFIEFKRLYPQIPVWINDLNPEVYYFWKVAQSKLSELVEKVRDIKANRRDGRELFEELANAEVESLSECDRAVRFFVLNRITFSGTIEAGGYSQKSFEERFTESAIDRLAKLDRVLKNVEITNLDYSELLQKSDRDIFIFLDPPYFTATKSRLYGKRGALHANFDHQRFAEDLKACSHNWLITYDDCLEIRQNFEFANLYKWQLQYGMNNYQQGKAEKGAELFIANYSTQKNTQKLNQNKRSIQLTLDL
ncbi:DNA adenine methylase [Baaleninema simplex]|uniref:DNA adenine methylase n=1 Tax=Baaleninema simplex TaxID=2862350 RepID=UPI000349459A|nr:DNA adenine methylase [Baaleninema simplex]